MDSSPATLNIVQRWTSAKIASQVQTLRLATLVVVVCLHTSQVNVDVARGCVLCSVAWHTHRIDIKYVLGCICHCCFVDCVHVSAQINLAGCPAFESLRRYSFIERHHWQIHLESWNLFDKLRETQYSNAIQALTSKLQVHPSIRPVLFTVKARTSRLFGSLRSVPLISEVMPS